MSLVLKPGERRRVLDMKESGELIIVEFHAHDSPKLAIEVNLWGDDGSPITIMDFHHDFDALLMLGWGLTPGMVKPIAGISPDPVGTPNGVHPFITRYKMTSEADALNHEGEHYSMAYAPVVPIPYGRRIQINIYNGDKENAEVHDLVVNRRVYGDSSQLSSS
jgi:hypothetical protein